MGRGTSSSNMSITKNPSKIRLDFKAGSQQGFFQYYNGEENVDLKQLDFIPLEDRVCVIGWNDVVKDRLYSNMIVNYSEELVVKWGSDSRDLIRGIWKDIKATVKLNKGKYCQRVFAYVVTGDFKGEIVQIDFAGSASSAWIGIKNDVKVFSEDVVISFNGEFEQTEKGDVSWRTPILEWKESSKSSLFAEANEANKLVNEYLTGDGGSDVEVFGGGDDVKEHLSDLAAIKDADELLVKWKEKCVDIRGNESELNAKIMGSWQVSLDNFGSDLTLVLDPEFDYLDDLPF
jgi:hypothetical protein